MTATSLSALNLRLSRSSSPSPLLLAATCCSTASRASWIAAASRLRHHRGGGAHAYAATWGLDLGVDVARMLGGCGPWTWARGQSLKVPQVHKRKGGGNCTLGATWSALPYCELALSPKLTICVASEGLGHRALRHPVVPR